jgi:hypothetical protein
MSFEGIVQNGVVVLEGDQKLPEGTRVEVIVRDGRKPSLSDRLLKLAGTIDDLPSDMARNHDHYIHGVPRR